MYWHSAATAHCGVCVPRSTIIDLEKGTIQARKHYFSNLGKPYFDELTILLERVADDEYRLFMQSDGILPTFRSDKKRNQTNLQRLIGYITG